MVEVELKSVVPDWDSAVGRVEASGATLVFAGRLEDRQYDNPEGALAARDHMLRLRVYREAKGVSAELDWKGPTTHEGGFKRREELGSHVADHAAMSAILAKLGFGVTLAVDRTIRQYELLGATVRFERYPGMDSLIEVEGTPQQIERAIAATGIPRADFSSARLAEFVRRYERRTGSTAVLSDAAPAGTQQPTRADG